MKGNFLFLVETEQMTSRKNEKDKILLRRSCESCRQTHSKCDSGTPCSNCKKNNWECVYSQRKQRQQYNPIRKTRKQLEQEIQNLQNELQIAKNTAQYWKQNYFDLKNKRRKIENIRSDCRLYLSSILYKWIYEVAKNRAPFLPIDVITLVTIVNHFSSLNKKYQNCLIKCTTLMVFVQNICLCFIHYLQRVQDTLRI